MKKITIAIISLILLVGFIFIVFRFVANGGEDTWVCSQGEWLKHGQPSRPAPTGSCLMIPH
jgi:uncharacterized protein YxeA